MGYSVLVEDMLPLKIPFILDDRFQSTLNLLSCQYNKKHVFFLNHKLHTKNEDKRPM